MAKIDDPALLVYTKDFLEGTADLSAEEFGVYVRLIFHQHQRGILPPSFKKLARLGGVTFKEFELIWREIVLKFTPVFTDTDTVTDTVNDTDTDTVTDTREIIGYKNLRCEAEMLKRNGNSLLKNVWGHFGNFLKEYEKNNKITAKNRAILKKSFSENIKDNFLTIPDDIRRKASIYTFLNNILKNLTENGNRTHIKNGNGDGNGNGNAIVKEKENVIVDEKIKKAFLNSEFLENWNIWKEYKEEEFKFSYKSNISENKAITQLYNLSQGNTKKAIQIINHSISQGWKGLFKSDKHDKTNSNNGSEQHISNMQTANKSVDDYFTKP